LDQGWRRLPAIGRILWKDGGLVRESHPDYDARVRVYALNARPLGKMKAWLEATEGMWAANSPPSRNTSSAAHDFARHRLLQVHALQPGHARTELLEALVDRARG
jgi:hypothetical protein